MIQDESTSKLAGVLRKHIEEIRPYTFDLSRKNIDFVNSLGVTSATIASFSLLTLQINQSILIIDAALLITGFKILIWNVFLTFLVSRLWIDIEERPIRQSLEILKLNEKLMLISKSDPKFSLGENQKQLKEIVLILKSTNQLNERGMQERMTWLLGKFIYINLILFATGIFIISKAILNV